MQTFVPLTSSFEDIARTLDRARLNKQALEGWQILMTLLELDPQGNHRAPKGWVNHPAVKMWRGHEMALYLYIQAMVDEWKRRGYKSTIGDKAKATIKVALSNGLLAPSASSNPRWISDMQLFKKVAASHRLALLNKDYEWYSQFNWEEDPGKKPETYEYIWPE
jgi:hypothetical protein